MMCTFGFFFLGYKDHLLLLLLLPTYYMSAVKYIIFTNINLKNRPKITNTKLSDHGDIYLQSCITCRNCLKRVTYR